MRELKDLGVAFMVTGSFASSLQGEPRATQDIDLVVELEESDVDALVSRFPSPDYYVSEQAVRDAVRRKTMFDVLSTLDGDTVDFWLLTDTPFDAARFSRRRVERAFDVDLPVSTPEDTILMKLSWARRSSGSEKQHTDALRIYEVQAGALDEVYLDRWARALGIETELAPVREESSPLDDPAPDTP